MMTVSEMCQKTYVDHSPLSVQAFNGGLGLVLLESLAPLQEVRGTAKHLLR
jgi:hypothetical protein